MTNILVVANRRDYSLNVNAVSLTLETNKRDYSLDANEFDAGVEYTLQISHDRVTSFGDTRIIDAGDIRIVNITTASNPNEIIANKRAYFIYAPLVEVE